MLQALYLPFHTRAPGERGWGSGALKRFIHKPHFHIPTKVHSRRTIIQFIQAFLKQYLNLFLIFGSMTCNFYDTSSHSIPCFTNKKVGAPTTLHRSTTASLGSGGRCWDSIGLLDVLKHWDFNVGIRFDRIKTLFGENLEF